MRHVRLGRKPISVGVGHHWAVQVDEGHGSGYWYEIEGAGKDEKGAANRINRSYGRQAASTAGALGGEVVGKTSKDDEQIMKFNNRWLRDNPTYELYSTNCQKYAVEFINWLTNGNYRINHSLDAGCLPDEESSTNLTFAHDGHAYAGIGAGKRRGQVAGALPSAVWGPNAEAEAIAGPGLYAGANASLGGIEANYGNVIGARIEPNLNTGVGVRGGNVEASVLGFGGKLGTDGLEVATPLGAIRAPWVGAPINWVGNLFR